MIVYFVRHGQSTGNVDRSHQTMLTPLSPLGEIQAGKLAERLKNLKLNEIVSSPMVRAKHTAEIINDYQHVPLTENNDLREIKRARSVEGKRYDDPTIRKMRQQINLGSEIGPGDPYFKFEDSESLAEFILRMRKIIIFLEKKSLNEVEDYELCVVAHGFVVATLFLICTLDEFATPEALHFALGRLHHENTGVTMVKFNKDGYKKVLTFNDFSHL